AIVDLPFVLFFVFVVWLIAGPLAMILAITVPLVLIAGLIIQIPLGAAVRSGFRDAGSKHGVLIETIGGLETIKSVGAEGRMRRQWEEAVASSARSGVRARSLSLLGLNLTVTMQQVATIALVVFGVLLISEGGMTVGALIAVVILGGRAMAPLAQVAQLLTRLHQARTSFKALDRIMRAPVERAPSREFLHRPQLAGEITFRDLSFAYPGQDIQALKGLSFAIKAGEKVGLIGRVGSGKSTVAKLLLGLYQPAEGSVLVDGTDLRQIDPANLRRNIGCVPQDVVLFRGTVRENLVIGAPQAEDAAILQAAKQSGVEDFVAQHPMGYDLPVGERGEGLSGGQRQALALARALLLDPPILVLDEPTSAMDNRSEEMLKTNLTTIAADKTLLLITHRASLLSLVDRLLVMDGGRVVADGPKQAVLDAIADGRISVMA
ncbi:MAG TPA: ATP-binding cassette domain-containing protein, partial [Alphaproteobacteria bacterium]|nr:ATP-binding cassette domain-containing protein [Alphaproteobacteria bacterium]